MDEAGWETAHVAGNSLGGYVTLQLAERGRARTAVVLAPAGGWAVDERVRRRDRRILPDDARPAAGGRTARGRDRRDAATAVAARPSSSPRTTSTFPPTCSPTRSVARRPARRSNRCSSSASAPSWSLDAERITCPVRVVWGTADRVLPWPAAATRYREEWVPNADWVALDDVGHCPQLDVPTEAAELIGDFAR